MRLRHGCLFASRPLAQAVVGNPPHAVEGSCLRPESRGQPCPRLEPTQPTLPPRWVRAGMVESRLPRTGGANRIRPSITASRRAVGTRPATSGSAGDARPRWHVCLQVHTAGMPYHQEPRAPSHEGALFTWVTSSAPRMGDWQPRGDALLSACHHQPPILGVRERVGQRFSGRPTR